MERLMIAFFLYFSSTFTFEDTSKCIENSLTIHHTYIHLIYLFSLLHTMKQTICILCNKSQTQNPKLLVKIKKIFLKSRKWFYTNHQFDWKMCHLFEGWISSKIQPSHQTHVEWHNCGMRKWVLFCPVLGEKLMWHVTYFNIS